MSTFESKKIKLLVEELPNELHIKAQKVGKFFFDEEVIIKECKSMTISTERTTGGFMTPLKNC